jgi:hypothetical protein
VIEKIIDLKDQETIKAYSEELNNAESLKILIKNNFGFYVLERFLIQCTDMEIISSLRINIQKGLQSLIGSNIDNGGEYQIYSQGSTTSNIQMRQKWAELLEKITSKQGGGAPLNVGRGSRGNRGRGRGGDPSKHHYQKQNSQNVHTSSPLSQAKHEQQQYMPHG